MIGIDDQIRRLCAVGLGIQLERVCIIREWGWNIPVAVIDVMIANTNDVRRKRELREVHSFHGPRFRKARRCNRKVKGEAESRHGNACVDHVKISH